MSIDLVYKEKKCLVESGKVIVKPRKNHHSAQSIDSLGSNDRLTRLKRSIDSSGDLCDHRQWCWQGVGKVLARGSQA